jgi:hypothetical protein
MTTSTVQAGRLESIPLAVVRRHARPSELARIVPECCGLVWNGLRALQVRAGRHVAIYWDDAIRLEVGVEILAPFAGHGDIVRSETPSGLAAWTARFGPYQQLGAAHDAVHRWCSTNNHRLAGPRWEIYGHWQRDWDDDPSRIRTDVYYLLSNDVG